MMRISSFHKTLCLALLVMLPVMGRADDVFRHYQGIANKEGDYEVIDASKNCYRQKTHECYYTIPVGETAGATVNLVLPFSDYNAGGSDLEPQGYFRWYNYDTDRKSDNLYATNAATTKLVDMSDGNGVSKGLVAYRLNAYPTSKNVGVTYKRPSDPNWKGETIACDVSKYIDCMKDGQFQHESTLSIRYIFHLIPAKKMADDMLNAILKGEESKVNDLTYEDNKEISVGLKDDNASFNLRLNTTNVSDYYFHPMSGIPQHHVFYDNESHKIKKEYFDTTKIMQANLVMWRVYTEDKSRCTTFWKRGRFLTLSMKGLNGTSEWRNQNDVIVSKPTFTYGSRIYVVGYVYNSSNPNVACPVANFTVTFYNYYPMTKAEIQQHAYNTRLVSYLDEHYKKVATISFDNDNDEQTLTAPTSADDNMSRLPSKWSKRSYGFVFRDLVSKATGQGAAANRYRSPIHGEYGLYKSANLNRISGNNQNQYHWWNGNLLYDRTHEITNGTEYGYFLYVDAADESRQIAEADFKANLCAGSQVIFSSAIADMTTYNAAERPQLMFKLYGVHYDESTNNETDRKLLYSWLT